MIMIKLNSDKGREIISDYITALMVIQSLLNGLMINVKQSMILMMMN